MCTCRTFRWALSCGGKVPVGEGLENPDLPEGTGEFLDAWLMLLEKMVNPKMVLESPHTLPSRTAVAIAVGASGSAAVPTFNPVLYLIHTHKRAFEAIMQLWDRKPLKVYGDRMSESMLAILCHLLRGEALIKEKLAKEKDSAAAAAAAVAAAAAAAAATTTMTTTLAGGVGSSSTAAAESILQGSARGSRAALGPASHEEINQDHLQQLMDMGFCRELATEALAHSASLEQATDYLLSHPTPLAPVVPPATSSPLGGTGTTAGTAPAQVVSRMSS